MTELAVRLSERGHRLWFLAPWLFEPPAPGIPGVVFHSIFEEAEARPALQDPVLWHPQKGIELAFRSMANSVARTVVILERLASFASASGHVPCLAATSIALGARLAQERWGWPLATVDVSAAFLMSADDPAMFSGLGWMNRLPRRWREKLWAFIDVRLLDPLVAPRLNAWRARFGLAPVKRVVGRWRPSPDLVVGLWPSWYAPLPADAPRQMRLTGFVESRVGDAVLPEALDRFLGDDHRTLVFMAGSQMRHSAALFRRAIVVARQLGYRALFLGPGATQAAAGKPEAHGEEFVPLALVLPRCAAMVSHPGIGTIAQGLAAGIPQVLTPYAFDQFENARRAVEMGVAVTIPPNSGARRIAAALAHALEDPKVAAACRDARDRMALEPDGAGSACDAIEALRARALSGASRPA